VQVVDFHPIREHRHTVVAAGVQAGVMTEKEMTPAGKTAAEHALSVWMQMWNESGQIAREVCAPEFRIHFGATEPDGSTPGDDIRTADEFADFVDWFREQHAHPVFTGRHHALDGRHGRMVWDVDVADIHAGGIDIFDFDVDGRISEVWSVTGKRPLEPRS
jgi:hypothetical protein